MPAAVQHAQVLFPRPDGFAILMRHHTRELMQMIQIVRRPRGKKLPQGHSAEIRMPAAAVKVGGSEIEVSQMLQIFGAQACEFVQELRQQRPVRLLGFPIERSKRTALSEFQHNADSRNPICLFCMDQMADDIERRPGVGPFVAMRPSFGQSAQESIQRGGRVREQSYCLFEEIVHFSLLRTTIIAG